DVPGARAVTADRTRLGFNDESKVFPGGPVIEGSNPADLGHGGQMIVGDADRVRLIVVGAVKDAVVCIPPGGFDPDIELVVEVAEFGRDAVAQMRDVGAGISPGMPVGIEDI